MSYLTHKRSFWGQKNDDDNITK